MNHLQSSRPGFAEFGAKNARRKQRPEDACTPGPGRKIATQGDTRSLTWYVQTSEGYFKGSSVQGLSLEYGKTPPRYVQIVPTTTSVPKLALHMVYYFHAETTNAPPAEGFFYVLLS